MGFLKKLGLRKKKPKSEPSTEDTNAKQDVERVSTQASSQTDPPHVQPPKAVDLLAAADFDISDLDKLARDSLPFLWACDHGHNQVLKLLFLHKPDPESLNLQRLETVPREYYHRSVVDVGIERQHLICVVTLHRNGVNITDQNRKLAYDVIFKKDTVVDLDDIRDVVLGDWFPPNHEDKALGPAASERAESMFQNAIRNSRPELTKWLWENGVEKYKRKQKPYIAWADLEEDLAIDEADASPSSRNLSLEYLRSVGIVETLKEQGFYDLLHRLVRGSHFRREEALGRVSSMLAKGWDVNGRDRNGKTPLHIAIRGSEVRMMELLIKHGADVNARENNPAARTPVLLAMEHNDPVILYTLLQNGAQFRPDAQDDLCAVLFVAAAADNAMAVKMLLEQGANPRVKNAFGETPYKVAMLRNSFGAAALLKPGASSGDNEFKTSSAVKNIEAQAFGKNSTPTVDNKPLDNAVLRWD